MPKSARSTSNEKSALAAPPHHPDRGHRADEDRPGERQSGKERPRRPAIGKPTRGRLHEGVGHEEGAECLAHLRLRPAEPSHHLRRDHRQTDAADVSDSGDTEQEDDAAPGFGVAAACLT